jgi:predicted phage tail protein
MGLRYDQASATTNQRVMSKPKLELRFKSDSEILAFARAHITAVTGNPNFTALSPAAVAFLATVDAYEAGLNESISKSLAAQTATAEKDNLRFQLETALTQRASSVEIESGGDEAKILSAGFATKASPSPVGAMTQPGNLRATMGANTGVIIAQWDVVKGAKSYILECRTHGATVGAWTQAKILTTTKFQVPGLTPGQEYGFRVRAVGSSGEGPWSDEAVKMAPA